MAKFDQGGGCPCGLYRECECDMAEVRKVFTVDVGSMPVEFAKGYVAAFGDHFQQVGWGWNPDVTKTETDPRQLEMVWDARDALTERGVERAVTWGPKAGDGPSLGDKLKATLAVLEAAKIKGLEEQAAWVAADVAKIERKRADIAHFVENLKNTMIASIDAGKVPLVKVTSYERRMWVEAALKGNALHQMYWREMRDWFGQEKLSIEVTQAHDGVGMDSWLNVTLKPSESKVVYRGRA